MPGLALAMAASLGAAVPAESEGGSVPVEAQPVERARLRVWVDPAAPPALLQTLRVHLEDLPAEIGSAGEAGPGLEPSVRLTRIGPSRWRISIERPGDASGWSREIAEAPDSPAASAEALGVALRHAARVALTPVPPAGPRDSLDAAPSRLRASWLRIGASYQATTYAGAVPWLSGFRLDVGFAHRSGAVVALAYTLHPRIRVELAEGTLTVMRHPLEAMVGWQRSGGPGRGPRFLYGFEGALVVDPTQRWARAEAPGWSAAGGAVGVSVGASTRGRLGVGWSRWSVALAAGPEVWFGRRTYAVRRESGEDAVLVPFRVRFVGLLGVWVRL